MQNKKYVENDKTKKISFFFIVRSQRLTHCGASGMKSWRVCVSETWQLCFE